MKKRMRTVKGRLSAGAISILLALSGPLPVLAGTGGFVFLDEDEGWTIADEAAEENGEEREKELVTFFAGRRAAAASSSDLVLPASSSNLILPASASNLMLGTPRSSLGDLWENWDDADFSFLDGTHGTGGETDPYQISTAQELKGLSLLTAMGMSVEPGEGSEEIVGNYAGKYFELTANINLNGEDWIPIGYYEDSSQFTGEVPHPFTGHLDGNGHTVSGYVLNEASWPNIGFFGAMKDASVRDLTLDPDGVVNGEKYVGILAGTAEGTTIFNCEVSGALEGKGSVGGVVGKTIDTVIENVTAEVTVNETSNAAGYAGGITGQAQESAIVDCSVHTSDNVNARIQGADASVGGITGQLNDSRIYNAYVTGTIGGAGSQNVGGMIGTWESGKLKVARFEGTIAQTGTGAAGHRGTFIGYRDAGHPFQYGTGASQDVAYLFADSEAAIQNNVCGSGMDDNAYTYGAHIGFWHSGDLFYTLVSGGNTKPESQTYFYEELENGILCVLDYDLDGELDPEANGFDPDHFAPNNSGRPTRGYLITIPQIDTIVNGQNYYDVATLEVKGNNTYCRTLNKEHRGAVAPGTKVTVTTAPNNSDSARFQPDGVPTYEENGKKKDTSYVDGGYYVFTMPEQNTEVTAVYKKVAVSVSTNPKEVKFQVKETRTGDRKNPTKTITVTDQNGKQLATYVNGVLQGTKVYPVNVEAIVDKNNDVADSSVKWSVDDVSLVTLLANDDETDGGYTNKSASLQVRLDAPFITDTRNQLEEAQRESGYKNKIPDTIFGAGHQNNGIAILTAATKPSASFDGKPCTATARISVTYQIIDNTYLGVEGASLDHQTLTFDVVRSLTGNRKNPQEAITVTAPQPLKATFNPDYFDKDEISWSVSDSGVLAAAGENREASVRVYADAAWIQNLIAQDAGKHANDPYALQTASGTRTETVTVKADDRLGNYQEASCQVTIRFKTVDESVIHVEGITVSPKTLSYNLKQAKSGPRSNPTITWTGNKTEKIVTSIIPASAFNKKVTYAVSDDSLKVSADGTVTVNTDAEWIKKVNGTYPYKGTHSAVITAKTEDGGFTDRVTVTFSYEYSDTTYSGGGGSSGGGGGSSSGGGGGGGGSSSGAGPGGGTGPAGDGSGPAGGSAPAGSVTGTWVNTADGLWAFISGGRTYFNEWAYVHNPYAAAGQSTADWFRFDATGHMATGWYQDTDGNLYYLWPYSDGTQGHMVTGWRWIPGADGLLRCYYFNEVSDGTRGRLYRNEVTPDGYTVNAAGEWVVNGLVQVRENE